MPPAHRFYYTAVSVISEAYRQRSTAFRTLIINTCRQLSEDIYKDQLHRVNPGLCYSATLADGVITILN